MMPGNTVSSRKKQGISGGQGADHLYQNEGLKVTTQGKGLEDKSACVLKVLYREEARTFIFEQESNKSENCM